MDIKDFIGMNEEDQKLMIQTIGIIIDSVLTSSSGLIGAFVDSVKKNIEPVNELSEFISENIIKKNETYYRAAVEMIKQSGVEQPPCTAVYQVYQSLLEQDRSVHGRLFTLTEKLKSNN